VTAPDYTSTIIDVGRNAWCCKKLLETPEGLRPFFFGYFDSPEDAVFPEEPTTFGMHIYDRGGELVEGSTDVDAFCPVWANGQPNYCACITAPFTGCDCSVLSFTPTTTCDVPCGPFIVPSVPLLRWPCSIPIYLGPYNTASICDIPSYVEYDDTLDEWRCGYPGFPDCDNPKVVSIRIYRASGGFTVRVQSTVIATTGPVTADSGIASQFVAGGLLSTSATPGGGGNFRCPSGVRAYFIIQTGPPYP